MDSPVTIVKSSINPGRILGWLVTALVALAIADATGLTNYLLFPYTTLKAKFSKGS